MSQEIPDRRTLVTFLLDRTGAEEHIRDPTIAAFNAYLDALGADGDTIEFTLILFDDESFDPMYVGTPIRNVPNLERKTYVSHLCLGRPGEFWLPSVEVGLMRHSVPVIDATWKTVTMVADTLRWRDDKPKVVLCIQVSGAEGCSKEHTWEGLRTLITLKAAQGWQFNFLGTGCAVYEHGTLMGIPASHVAECHRQMDGDQFGEKATERLCTMFRAAAQNTLVFARSDQASTAFSAEQKAALSKQHVRRHADYEAAREWIFGSTAPIY